MATTAAAMAGNMEPDDQLYNEAVELDHAWMKHFVRGRVFDQAPNTNEQEGASAGQAEQMPKIESLDFHQSEQLMVSVTTDAAIRVYDTKEGTQVKSFFSTKYGAASVQFAHHPNCIIYASSRNNPAPASARRRASICGRTAAGSICRPMISRQSASTKRSCNASGTSKGRRLSSRASSAKPRVA